MRPPLLPRALLAAAIPPADFDSVSGDLHEEYVLLAQASGRADANRWYWSQAVRSIPPLLSYSRSPRSLGAGATTAAVVAAVLIAMLCANELLGDAISTFYHNASGVGAWPYFATGWTDAALFGAILAAIVRSQGLRLTFVASLVLVTVVAVPIAFGFSSPLSSLAWLLVLGAVPAMCAGAAAYQIVRRR